MREEKRLRRLAGILHRGGFSLRGSSFGGGVGFLRFEADRESGGARKADQGLQRFAKRLDRFKGPRCIGLRRVQSRHRSLHPDRSAIWATLEEIGPANARKTHLGSTFAAPQKDCADLFQFESHLGASFGINALAGDVAAGHPGRWRIRNRRGLPLLLGHVFLFPQEKQAPASVGQVHAVASPAAPGCHQGDRHPPSGELSQFGVLKPRNSQLGFHSPISHSGKMLGERGCRALARPRRALQSISRFVSPAGYLSALSPNVPRAHFLATCYRVSARRGVFTAAGRFRRAESAAYAASHFSNVTRRGAFGAGGKMAAEATWVVKKLLVKRASFVCANCLCAEKDGTARQDSHARDDFIRSLRGKPRIPTQGIWPDPCHRPLFRPGVVDSQDTAPGHIPILRHLSKRVFAARESRPNRQCAHPRRRRGTESSGEGRRRKPILLYNPRLHPVSWDAYRTA